MLRAIEFQPFVLRAQFEILAHLAVEFQTRAIHHHPVFFRREKFVPPHVLAADGHLRAVAFEPPCEGARLGPLQRLFSKRHLAQYAHEPQQSEARGRAEQRHHQAPEVARLVVEKWQSSEKTITETGGADSILQHRDRRAEKHARDRAAKRDFIRDDVVLEINERRDDEQRDEREQRQRHHPCAGAEPER